jgi:hypothetical protein
MTYNPAVPGASQRPSQSQGGMLTNFAQLNTQIGLEHAPLTTDPRNGKHKYVSLVRSPAAPAPVGNDLVLSQEVSNATPFLRVINSVGTSWPVALRYTKLNINCPVVGGAGNLVLDLSPYDSTNGTILIWRAVPSQSDQLFTTFVFPHFQVPKVQQGQLYYQGAGHVLDGLTTVGNVLMLKVTAATTVNITITWSAF